MIICISYVFRRHDISVSSHLHPGVMESVLNLFGSCFCLKPHLEVEGVTYKLLRHLTEGGFSSIDLVENTRSGKVFVAKRITCHSIEDQNVARNEIEINKKFK